MTEVRYDTSRGPVVRREVVKVARLISLDGIGPQDHTLRFEREVLTVRETEATSRLMTTTDRGAMPLDGGGTTHNDFYGLFTSQDQLVANNRALAARQGFGVGGPVWREVIVTMIERDLLASKRDEKRFGGTEYTIPPFDWCRDDEAFVTWREWYVGRGEGEEPAPPNRICRRTTREFTVWRSDLSERDNAVIMAEARAVVFAGLEDPQG